MPPTIVYTKPAQYNSSNFAHLRDSKQSLDKYSHLLRWKEGERIIDIGCGTGNVMTQVLLPRLPADYKLLVGFDVSQFNVKFATENYSGPHIIYIQGDIIEPDFQRVKGFFGKENINIGFDKVFSFHCLGWVENSAQWSKNIYSLLNPGGQAFLQFFTYASFVEIWIEVVSSERWSPYTKTVRPYRSEFHYSTDINGDLTKLMTDAGFTVESCDHYSSYIDKDLPAEVVLRLMQSGDQYVHTIPEDLHKDYNEDLLRVLKKYLNKYAVTGLPYTTVVIVASKPEN